MEPNARKITKIKINSYSKDTDLQSSWTTQISRWAPEWSAARGTWWQSARRPGGSDVCLTAAWPWCTRGNPPLRVNQSSWLATLGWGGACGRPHAWCHTGQCSVPEPKAAEEEEERTDTDIYLMSVYVNTDICQFIWIQIYVVSKYMWRQISVSICNRYICQYM